MQSKLIEFPLSRFEPQVSAGVRQNVHEINVETYFDRSAENCEGPAYCAAVCEPVSH